MPTELKWELYTATEDDPATPQTTCRRARAHHGADERSVTVEVGPPVPNDDTIGIGIWKTIYPVPTTTTTTTTSTTLTTTTAPAPAPTPAPVRGCEQWCTGNTHAWSRKCTWNKCRKCDDCKSAVEVTGCKAWCAGNSHAWSRKCTWTKCKRCEECKPAEESEGCKAWCVGNSHAWSSKCMWKKCKRC